MAVRHRMMEGYGPFLGRILATREEGGTVAESANSRLAWARGSALQKPTSRRVRRQRQVGVGVWRKRVNLQTVLAR